MTWMRRQPFGQDLKFEERPLGAACGDLDREGRAVGSHESAEDAQRIGYRSRGSRAATPNGLAISIALELRESASEIRWRDGGSAASSTARATATTGMNASWLPTSVGLIPTAAAAPLGSPPNPVTSCG